MATPSSLSVQRISPWEVAAGIEGERRRAAELKIRAVAFGKEAAKCRGFSRFRDGPQGSPFITLNKLQQRLVEKMRIAEAMRPRVAQSVYEEWTQKLRASKKDCEAAFFNMKHQSTGHHINDAVDDGLPNGGEATDGQGPKGGGTIIRDCDTVGAVASREVSTVSEIGASLEVKVQGDGGSGGHGGSDSQTAVPGMVRETEGMCNARDKTSTCEVKERAIAVNVTTEGAIGQQDRHRAVDRDKSVDGGNDEALQNANDDATVRQAGEEQHAEGDRRLSDGRTESQKLADLFNALLDAKTARVLIKDLAFVGAPLPNKRQLVKASATAGPRLTAAKGSTTSAPFSEEKAEESLKDELADLAENLRSSALSYRGILCRDNKVLESAKAKQDDNLHATEFAQSRARELFRGKKLSFLWEIAMVIMTAFAFIVMCFFITMTRVVA